MNLAKPILLILIAASAAPLAAQNAGKVVPPTIQAVPLPPPVMIAPPPPMAVPMVRSPNSFPPTTFQVEVLGGTERLWSGQLRVANYNSASYNSSVNEAPETCPADKSNLGRYAPNFSRSIRVGLNRRGYGYGPKEGENSFSISANWTRPGVPCEEDGSSSVSFDRTFTLEVGGKAEFKGDGGLVVRLSRVK